MPVKLMRAIVKIDEEKCDGCGICVPSCVEGAIKIIDGKARLVADNLCDGLGNCLGTCPRGAITIEHRAADAFDEEATHAADACGCPGAALRQLRTSAGTATHAGPPQRPFPGGASQLRHWPVQLHLLPVQSNLWQDADVLIAADCVGFAMPDFHGKLLAGKTLAVGCPKLDDIGAYGEKLAQVFAHNRVRSVTVAHMEVPCCTGIVAAVRQALARAGRADLLLRDITVGVDGSIQQVL